MANEPDSPSTPDTPTTTAKPAAAAPASAPKSSSRVTPKGGPDGSAPVTKAAARKAAAAKKDSPESSTKHVPKKVEAKAAARSGNPKKKAEATHEASRYTPPVPNSYKVSPWYIPVLMFGFLGLGMVIIFLNYVQWPFGEPDNVRLMLGLLSILIGILVATRLQ